MYKSDELLGVKRHFTNDQAFWRLVPEEIQWKFLDYVRPVFIYRAEFSFYMREPDWLVLQSMLWGGSSKLAHKDRWTSPEGGLLDKSTVRIFLKYYGEGFINGFEGFDLDVIGPTILKGDADKMATLIKNKAFQQIDIGELKMEYNDMTTVNKERWIACGREGGSFFRAWFLIVNRPDTFIDSFHGFPTNFAPVTIPEFRIGPSEAVIETSEDVDTSGEITIYSNYKHGAAMKEHLSCLRGTLDGRKIMSEKDYLLLLQLVDQLIKKCEVPELEATLQYEEIRNDFFLHTFYRLHKAVYRTRRIYHHWGVFLKKYFSGLDGIEAATITITWSQCKNYKDKHQLIDQST